MIYLILWLIVVAAAIGANIWYYIVSGRIAYEYVPLQLAIIILEGIICYSGYLASV